jgi:hypothetical protein
MSARIAPDRSCDRRTAERTDACAGDCADGTRNSTDTGADRGTTDAFLGGGATRSRECKKCGECERFHESLLKSGR